MMRKIFGGTLVLSIVGAVILGGVLAFNSSQTTATVYQVKIGDAAWTLNYQASNTVLVPSNVENIGIGAISTPDSNTMDITEVGGSVNIVGLPNGCANDIFGNSIQFASNTDGGGPVTTVNGLVPDGVTVQEIGPGVTFTPFDLATNTLSDLLTDPNTDNNQGVFLAQMSVGLNGHVPAACYGGTVSYTVTINVAPTDSSDSSVTTPD